jgi:hypothetical protein
MLAAVRLLCNPEIGHIPAQSTKRFIVPMLLPHLFTYGLFKTLSISTAVA